MNSLDALERIKTSVKTYPLNDLLYEHHFDDFNKIQKDLEVLNILKENIVECIGDSAGNEYLKLLLHKFSNEEKYNKVKVWLDE